MHQSFIELNRSRSTALCCYRTIQKKNNSQTYLTALHFIRLATGKAASFTHGMHIPKVLLINEQYTDTESPALIFILYPTFL